MITVQKKKKKKESWSVINTESTSFLIPIDDHHLQDGLIIIFYNIHYFNGYI